ncbi:histone-like nucleoid-structuring protein Lsr2 [Nocardia aurantiaca]|uniref:Lsr2 family protein n=1 Tax=Nocardia aurantiaca TaxID=2675850 RepID=A0A6I3L7P8_9NOCA|nr:Lsr2 family protein [Nocardia aurantiaca]MTE17030.1 Lsr2 family protein [Nocardia aurantiaca]
MARKVTIQLVDDFDKTSPAQETVRFGLDGTQFEIDLSTVNAGALRGALEQWTVHARKVGRTARTERTQVPAAARPDNAAIRVWANANGYEVSSRGRIHADVLKAYQAAN